MVELDFTGFTRLLFRRPMHTSLNLNASPFSSTALSGFPAKQSPHIGSSSTICDAGTNNPVRRRWKTQAGPVPGPGAASVAPVEGWRLLPRGSGSRQTFWGTGLDLYPIRGFFRFPLFLVTSGRPPCLCTFCCPITETAKLCEMALIRHAAGGNSPAGDMRPNSGSQNCESPRAMAFRRCNS